MFRDTPPARNKVSGISLVEKYNNIMRYKKLVILS